MVCMTEGFNSSRRRDLLGVEYKKILTLFLRFPTSSITLTIGIFEKISMHTFCLVMISWCPSQLHTTFFHEPANLWSRRHLLSKSTGADSQTHCTSDSFDGRTVLLLGLMDCDSSERPVFVFKTVNFPAKYSWVISGSSTSICIGI